MERRAGAALARAGVSAVSRAQLGSAQALAASRTASAARAEAMAQNALVEGRRIEDVHALRLAVVALVEAARNEGRHSLALDRFADLRRLSDTAYEAEEIRTLQHLDAGDREFALKASRLADLVASRNPAVATLDGTALHIRGLLADDPDVLADAVNTLRQSPRPVILADALKDLGSTLITRNRIDEAVLSLAEAIEIYQRVGVVSRARVVSNLLRSQGIRGVRVSHPAPRPPSGWAALTPTELRVVELVSAGYTNRAAAGELSVSTNTVNTHLRAVFRKLGVKSRVQLTIAWRNQPA